MLTILAQSQTSGLIFFLCLVASIVGAILLMGRCFPLEPDEIPEDVIRRVMGNVASGVAKIHDAPCSAQTHFDSALAELAKHTDWRPDNEELAEIVEDAVDHIGLLAAFNGDELKGVRT